MDLSVVVPLYNEQENIPALYREITEAISKEPISYEILMVDDGSVDDGFEVAKDLARQDKRLKIIRLRRNYGQTPAMAAGIDKARGRIVVTMDGDLQNDPRDIPMMLAKIGQGYHIVVGWRFDRQDKMVTRKVPSKIANWLIGKVTGVPIRDSGCSLKAYRATVIKQVPLYSEMHRFIPAMASISGARIAEVKVNHHPRKFGKSKYGLSRIYKVLIDLITIKTLISFSTKPLYWFSILASFFFLLSSVLLVTLYLTSTRTPGVWVTMGGIGLLVGALSIFLFCIGILGELVLHFGEPPAKKPYRDTAVVVNPTENLSSPIPANKEDNKCNS